MIRAALDTLVDFACLGVALAVFVVLADCAVKWVHAWRALREAGHGE